MTNRIFLQEKNIMIAVLANAAVIFLLYFPSLTDNIWLNALDQFFILFFMVEAFVKLRLLGKTYFSSTWNWFDFFLVIISFPSLLMNFIELPDASFVLLLRLFRMIRLVRFISFIPNLTKIVEGLGRALKSSVFVLLALFILNFVLAIFTCHFYGNVCEELFGDPLVSFYSIFQMFTVEGWNEIPSRVAENLEHPALAWLMRFYFGMVVLLGGIFGMSLANAVFVDEMTIDNNTLLETKIDTLQQEIQELKALLVRRTQQ